MRIFRKTLFYDGESIVFEGSGVRTVFWNLRFCMFFQKSDFWGVRSSLFSVLLGYGDLPNRLCSWKVSVSLRSDANYVDFWMKTSATPQRDATFSKMSVWPQRGARLERSAIGITQNVRFPSRTLAGREADRQKSWRGKQTERDGQRTLQIPQAQQPNPLPWQLPVCLSV